MRAWPPSSRQVRARRVTSRADIASLRRLIPAPNCPFRGDNFVLW